MNMIVADNRSDYGHSNRINMVLTAITIIIMITPYLNRNFPTILWAVLIVLWDIDVLVKKSFKIVASSSLIVFFLWFGWCIFLRVVGRSTAAIGNYFLLLCSIDIIVKCFYIYKEYSNDEKRKLVLFSQIIIFVNVLYNLILWVRDSSAFANFYFYSQLYENTNKIESARFYNMLAFYIGCCLFCFLTARKRGYRVFAIIQIIVSSIFLLFVNPRMNAILIALVLCISIYWKVKKPTASKMIISILLILGAFSAIFIFRNQILKAIDPRLSVRVESLLYLVSGKGSNIVENSSIGDRIQLQLNSLRTFISSVPNMLIGSGLRLGQENYSALGQHGFITDTIGAYGLVGILFLCYFFFGWYREFGKMLLSDNGKKLSICIRIAFLFAAIICSSFYMEVCLSAFLLPVLMEGMTINEVDG